MPEPAKVAAIRALLPATGAGIYLNAGTAGPMPSETQRAMDEQAQRELAVGRGLPDLLPEILERMGEARAAVAAVIVAAPDDVALTHSVSDGLNLLVNALPWAPGDRVLTTRHEHPGGLGPLLALRERLGVEVEFVDVGDGGDDERTIAAFAAALERPARAILASHVLWTTGAVLPIRRLGELARSAGAVMIADGAQAAGAIPVSVEELAVDAYAIAGHKWLLGPEGMAALWVRRGLADSRDPRARLVPVVRGVRPAAAGAAGRRPAVRGDGLPPTVGRRPRAQLRLDLDVRRAPVGAGARDPPGGRGGGPAGGHRRGRRS